MLNKRIIILPIMILVLSTIYAARYTIRQMSDSSPKIGKRALKIGDSFSHEEIYSIKWTSNKQWIEVKDGETKDYIILTKENVKKGQRKKLSPWKNLWNYITKESMLTVRGKAIPLQFTDTLRIPIPRMAEDSIYRAHFESTKTIDNSDLSFIRHITFEKYNDGRGMYLTREKIFGPYSPKTVKMTLWRYHSTSEDEGDLIGTLFIEPLSLPQNE